MPQSFEAWAMESSSGERRDLNLLKQIAEIWWNQTRTINPPRQILLQKFEQYYTKALYSGVFKQKTRQYAYKQVKHTNLRSTHINNSRNKEETTIDLSENRLKQLRMKQEIDTIRLHITQEITTQ